MVHRAFKEENCELIYSLPCFSMFTVNVTVWFCFFKITNFVLLLPTTYPNQSVNKYSVIATPLAYNQVLVCLEVTLVDIKIG